MKTAGGFTGAILLTLTFYLFSGIGAKIVGYFMIIIAILMVTNLSIADLLQKMYQWLSQLMKKIKNEFSKKKISKHRSEEHTSELQSRGHLVCRLLLEKKKK